MVKQASRDRGEGGRKDESIVQNSSQHDRTGGQRNDAAEKIAYFL